MKVYYKDFFRKMWTDPQFSADWFTYTKKIPKGKLNFLYSERSVAQK